MNNQFGFSGRSNQGPASGADKGGSIKQTLMRLEDMIRVVQEDINQSKRECQLLRGEKEQLEQVLSHKSSQVRSNLSHEANRVEEELKKNLNAQKVENVKVQGQIGVLKQEKVQLQQNLMGLQRRIKELEVSIGGTDAQQDQ